MAITRNGQIIANLKRGTSQIAFVFQGTVQIWAHEVVVVLGASGTAAYAADLFEAAKPGVFASSTPKRLVVPQGVERGSAGTWVLAIVNGAQAASYGGTLTIEIAGTLSGRGGTPNSGVGGDVIWTNVPGKDGQLTNIKVLSTGVLRSGGGGGGRGGNGGQGVWYSGRTVTESPNMASSSNSFYYPDYYWAKVNSENQSSIWWYSTNFPNRGLNDTSYYNGGYTYYRGAFKFTQWHEQGTTDYYYVYRTHVVYDVPNYTSGGAGGNGGRGQGYDGAAVAGSAGAAGGTNAGTGGSGGSGGGWGAAGASANSGASGNYTGGSAGAVGGLAGFYLKDSVNAVLNNLGVVLGRVS